MSPTGAKKVDFSQTKYKFNEKQIPKKTDWKNHQEENKIRTIKTHKI